MLQGKVFKILDFMEDSTGIRKVRFDTKATANILYMLPYASNTDYIAIGNGTLLMDLKLFGSASTNHVLWDASANNIVFTGSTGISLGTSSALILPVKAVGSVAGTAGDMWLDTTDGYIHYYYGGVEYKIGDSGTATA